MEHMFFNLSIENVSLIATNKLKFCLPMFIISSSVFLLLNIYQYFDYCNKNLFYPIDQFHNCMALIYSFTKKSYIMGCNNIKFISNNV